MMHYPLDLPVWASMIGVALLAAGAIWVGLKDGSSRSVGLMAVPIAVATGWTWFTSLSVWTAVIVLAVTTVIFLFGMKFRDEDHDNGWHFGALGVALFGKMILAAGPLLGDLLTGEIPVKGWMFLVAAVIVAAVVWLKKSKRFKTLVAEGGAELKSLM